MLLLLLRCGLCSLCFVWCCYRMCSFFIVTLAAFIPPSLFLKVVFSICELCIIMIELVFRYFVSLLLLNVQLVIVMFVPYIMYGAWLLVMFVLLSDRFPLLYMIIRLLFMFLKLLFWIVRFQ